jgi:hypothetical protein
MELSERLVLNKYFLDQFGFKSFSDFKERLKYIKEGFSSDGWSHFASVLITLENSKISPEEILKYDQAIREYTERLSKNRRDNITLKYFQYLAVLFSEIFLDRYFNRRKQFLVELNSFVDELNREVIKPEEKFVYFTEADLKKLAYWMATGSGKTFIMHINYWQFLKYATEKLDNIILVTPNEGLSQQHYKEMQKSGIPCRLYSENVGCLTLNPGEVLIIDIFKLTKEKKGAGVRVEVDYFEGNNLVFIDEGHKGQATDEKTWKKLREELGRTGFIFEYSATFGQVINPRDRDLLEEYSKAIIFDYSYKYFYTDGYGKDFYVYNLSERSFQERFRDLILTANLLSFYEQIILFETYSEELREYQIEKPLWAFIGSKVSGAGINSDVLKVVEFLKKAIENKHFLEENINKLLRGESGLTDPRGEDIFENRFELIRQKGYKTEEIYEKLFNSNSGSLSLYELKSAEGEIGLKMGEGDYFGVINIGDVASFKKLLAERGIDVKPDAITPSLFDKINQDRSSINILIGAKKFIEGWDSWRVCSMGLINMGKGEGPQIIQLFGRGVRLKGRNFSLKRSDKREYHIRALETLNIFGLNADYMNRFLETIQREGVEYEEVELPIRLMDKKKWDKLFVLQTPREFDFSNRPIKLELDENILRKVRIDIRPQVKFAHGLEVTGAEPEEGRVYLEETFTDLLDWDGIYLEILNYKITQGYFNLVIEKNILPEIVRNNGYQLYAFMNQVIPKCFDDLSKLKEVVLMLIKTYVDRFYNTKLRQEESKELQMVPLTEDHENLSFRGYVLKIPKNAEAEIRKIREILKQVEKLFREDSKEIPTIHFDRHLYAPLVVYGKGKDFIKSTPVRLNEGETEFVRKLRDYVKTNSRKFEDKELFLLRNLSQRGIRFFQTSGFYPDFIMWIKDKNKQTIAFIDPKGLIYCGSINHPKIQFHKDIKEVEKRLGSPNVRLESFILSVSEYSKVKEVFGGLKKEEFEDNHVLFMEDEKVIEKLLEKLL